MPILFHNQLPERLVRELNLARTLGVKPKFLREVADLDVEFAQICNTETIKWVINDNSELVIVPKFSRGVEIAHTVLTEGKPVLAAGEAEIAGQVGNFFGIRLDNQSGHYKPDETSLAIGRISFEKLGIRF